jgi:hypothetical protein
VVLDDLREGVVFVDIYDPTVNPLFRDVLAHYGVVALPCRIHDPDRKAYVHIAPHPTFATLKVGCLVRLPLQPLRTAPFFSGSYRQRRNLS